tara:strand:- start:676 stop:831 length:156 start_codon:yes stop_codon:yes gene_type:complete
MPGIRKRMRGGGMNTVKKTGMKRGGVKKTGVKKAKSKLAKMSAKRRKRSKG